jgi:hypothetical protein
LSIALSQSRFVLFPAALNQPKGKSFGDETTTVA